MTADMTRDEILEKVRDVLVDALMIDGEDVEEGSRLRADLGAESIDMLDISFKLEKAFGIKIGEDEMVPQSALQNPEYVAEGVVTAKGLEALRERMPHFDFAAVGESPTVAEILEAFTVATLVAFVERKLAAAH